MPENHASSLETFKCSLPKSFSSLDKLLDFLKLKAEDAPFKLDGSPNFRFLVPLEFASKMEKGSWQDPLLGQILPLELERQDNPGFCSDAVGDKHSEILPGVLHKYKSRVLIMPSSKCALHCRYCFRREFDYPEQPGNFPYEKLGEYLSKHPEVNEVILSGGDPLMAPNQRLEKLGKALLPYPQIQTLRIHSRVPISLPERVDPSLLKLMDTWSQQFGSLVFIHHINHPNELSGQRTLDILDKMQKLKIIQLNQSVLLRNINDSSQILADLSRSLIKWGILPYYLHQLDKVKGSSHFEVPIAKGHKLMESLRIELSGFSVPKYVQEIPGEFHKRPL